MTTVYDVAASELEETLRSWGEPAYRVRQVADALWRRGATYEEMKELPGALRERLAATFPLGIEVVEERLADRGATRKALLRLDGRHLVEAVLMGYPDRVTVCISSQAGCGMGCGFCATGQMGLLGNLTAGQIAAQVLWARREAARLPASAPQRLGNVVFMGMGEPLANEKQVFAAIARITDPAGIRLGARHITVSTVGLVPGIRNLATAHPQVGLAVSLHAADDATRTRLVPINRRYPLAELEEAVQSWRVLTNRRPSIEWAMIDGENDSDDQARLLAGFAKRTRAHVNLIPLNPTPGWHTQPSSAARIKAFVRVLEKARVTVTVRDTRGSGIEAACGQLRLSHDA